MPDLDAALEGVDVVVTAAIPGDRAEIGERSMRAGKRVLADKPGVTSVEQLDALRAAHAETGQTYTVLFSERLTTTAMVRAQDLVAAGRIGTVIHTVGLGPHTLNLKQRPEWFFDPARYGGILVDIGSHQVDQFLSFTGASHADVLASTIRSHPEHPGVEVLGEMLLAADGATGYARVDYFTPKGLAPAWGDVRFTVVGTDGYLEVRHVEQTVTVVDGDRQRGRRLHGRDRRLGCSLPRGHAVRPGARVRGLRDLPRCAAARPARRCRAPGGLTGALSKGSLTFSTSTEPRPPGALVIVCHCEAVNDKTVRAAVLSGANDVAAVSERCGAGLNCGGCHRMLERLVREHIAPVTASVAVA